AADNASDIGKDTADLPDIPDIPDVPDLSDIPDLPGIADMSDDLPDDAVADLDLGLGDESREAATAEELDTAAVEIAAAAAQDFGGMPGDLGSLLGDLDDEAGLSSPGGAQPAVDSVYLEALETRL